MANKDGHHWRLHCGIRPKSHYIGNSTDEAYCANYRGMPKHAAIEFNKNNTNKITKHHSLWKLPILTGLCYMHLDSTIAARALLPENALSRHTNTYGERQLWVDSSL
jgi:hypothetical protein